jgi:carboxyl-terminal processing protease
MAALVSSVGFVAVVAFLLSPAAAQDVAVRSPAVEVSELLRRGQELETEKRWGDALAHYEDAVRHFPEDRQLERRFETARLHYDLSRRYNDQTFCQSLGQLTTNESLDLYSDVLLKIQSHYVESPNWREMVDRGVASLEVALNEPAFVQRNVSADRIPAIDIFLGDLRRALAVRPTTSRDDVRDAAALAGQMGQSRLGIRPTSIILEFTCGATNSLDPYSAYLTAGQLSDVYSQIEGNFVGLGVELKGVNGTLLIVRVIPGSPAQRHGLVANDTIVAVNNQPTSDYTTDQAANMLQGPVGSVVDVTIVSQGREPRTARIQRERIDVPSIDEIRMADASRGIAYLKLVCFQKNTSRELDSALWQLHREGMRSLIMDLRGNPGGLLVAAVEVADKFVDRGNIVITRGRNPQEDFTYSAREEGTWRVPLVVIVDQDSASAAEIFAGAIRDHHRGTIVGTRSFGKGSVQGIFPLSFAGAGVRLTTAKFYSPNGRPYSRVGVEPDVYVHRTARPALAGVAAPAKTEDAILTAALQVAAQPTQSALSGR